MRTLRSRLTYANVMSTLAVFLVLGGTAVAARTLNGHAIVRHSITASKLKPNTLTGRQISESKLGTVRRAKNATRLAGIPAPGFLRATGKAADAERLDGVDSTAFARGPGVTVVRRGLSVPAGAAGAFAPVAIVPGLGVLTAACADAGRSVTLRYTSTTLARQFLTDEHGDAATAPATQGATLPPRATRDVSANDTAGAADFALSGRLTVVRDAPTQNSAVIEYGAVARPAGEGRCVVSASAVAG